jgi:hypothetical protein
MVAGVDKSKGKEGTYEVPHAPARRIDIKVHRTHPKRINSLHNHALTLGRPAGPRKLIALAARGRGSTPVAREAKEKVSFTICGWKLEQE